jgi:hypothetical protein
MTFEEFEDFLINDWSWRKREISDLILFAEEIKNKVMYKSFLLLLYAHWEGYIKKSSKAYLHFISKSSYKFCDLTDNFKALFLKDMSKTVNESKHSLTIDNELKFIEKIHVLNDQKISKKLKIDLSNEKDKAFVNTQDNVSTKVLKNILNLIGMSYKEQYDIKKSLIDIKFLGNRNAIGHGNLIIEEEDFVLEISTMKRLRDIIVLILESLRDELIEYGKNQYFLKINTSQRNQCVQKFNNELRIGFEEIDRRYS